MSEFINTIDVLGDDAVIDSIIERTITEFKDNVVTEVGRWAFYSCSKLTIVDLPNVVSLKNNALGKCSTLETVILRNSQLCTIESTNALASTPIASDAGYIYVPKSLVDSYKAATNWSTYANQIRAIEDWSVDGTVTGDIMILKATYSLVGMVSSNVAGELAYGRPYISTLALEDGYVLKSISITMNGVDITEDVYNPETGEVYIPSVTGDVVIAVRTAYENADLPILFYEAGSIGYDSTLGVETDNQTSARTDLVKFDGSADVSLSLSGYRVTLRGYDNNLVCKGANGQWTNMPGTITYSYPYLRLIIGKQDGSAYDRAVLDGSVITIDGVNYRLVSRDDYASTHEYITVTGQQYIMLPGHFNPKYDYMSITFSDIDKPNENRFLVSGTYGNQSYFEFTHTSTYGICGYMSNNSNYDFTTNISVPDGVSVLDVSNNSIRLNGTVVYDYTKHTMTRDDSKSTYIFGNRPDGRNLSAKVYSVTVRINGVTYDLRPYVSPDGEIGFVDTNTNVFYGSDTDTPFY